jgi:hypothetical protein
MFSLVCESYERGYLGMASFHAEIVKSPVGGIKPIKYLCMKSCAYR